mgnify:CR=1 FL=1|jgi:hypothetical protein
MVNFDDANLQYIFFKLDFIRSKRLKNNSKPLKRKLEITLFKWK